MRARPHPLNVPSRSPVSRANSSRIVARIEDASPHTMATHMIKSGATLRSVQEMLGHANIQTTSRYVSLAEEQLHKDVQDHAL